MFGFGKSSQESSSLGKWGEWADSWGCDECSRLLFREGKAFGLGEAMLRLQMPQSRIVANSKDGARILLSGLLNPKGRQRQIAAYVDVVTDYPGCAFPLWNGKESLFSGITLPATGLLLERVVKPYSYRGDVKFGTRGIDDVASIRAILGVSGESFQAVARLAAAHRCITVVAQVVCEQPGPLVPDGELGRYIVSDFEIAEGADDSYPSLAPQPFDF